MMMRYSFQVGLLSTSTVYDSTNRPTCFGLHVCVRIVELSSDIDDNGQNYNFLEAYTLLYEYDDEAHRWVDWSY